MQNNNSKRILSKSGKINFSQETHSNKNQNNSQPKFKLGSEKYSNMISQVQDYKKIGINLNLACHKTLYEIMHRQTRHHIDTRDDLNSVYQIDIDSKDNDTKELFYTQHHTITPILYKTILNMSAPDNIAGIDLEFNSQKTIIFNFTNILDHTLFETQYVRPFFNEQIKPILENEIFENFESENFSKQCNPENWWNEFKEKLYQNIILINYSSLIELTLKVQNFPNVIKILKDVSLVIIDSPNLLLSQEILLEYDENEENMNSSFLQNKKPNISFKNKRRSVDKEDQGLFETTYKVLNDFREEYNFNMIMVLYDYQRIEDVNYLKFKMTDQNFSAETLPKFMFTYIGEENRIQFIFSPLLSHDKHKIYSVEPFHSYVNININVFGYIIYIGEGKYKFFSFIKRGDLDQVKLLKENIFVANNSKEGK